MEQSGTQESLPRPRSVSLLQAHASSTPTISSYRRHLMRARILRRPTCRPQQQDLQWHSKTMAITYVTLAPAAGVHPSVPGFHPDGQAPCRTGSHARIRDVQAELRHLRLRQGSSAVRRRRVRRAASSHPEWLMIGIRIFETRAPSMPGLMIIRQFELQLAIKALETRGVRLLMTQAYQFVCQFVPGIRGS